MSARRNRKIRLPHTNNLLFDVSVNDDDETTRVASLAL